MVMDNIILHFNSMINWNVLNFELSHYYTYLLASISSMIFILFELDILLYYSIFLMFTNKITSLKLLVTCIPCII